MKALAAIILEVRPGADGTSDKHQWWPLHAPVEAAEDETFRGLPQLFEAMLVGEQPPLGPWTGLILSGPPPPLSHTAFPRSHTRWFAPQAGAGFCVAFGGDRAILRVRVGRSGTLSIEALKDLVERKRAGRRKVCKIHVLSMISAGCPVQATGVALEEMG